MKPYSKAIVAVLGAVVTAILTQFPDSQAVQQWGPIVMALLTAVGVYAVPNDDPAATHQDESTRPPQAGAVDLGFVVVLILVVVIVLVLLGVAR